MSRPERRLAANDRPEPGAIPRARLAALLDRDSFVELDAHVVHRSDGPGMAGRRVEGDGVVTGIGRIDGHPVAVYAQDPAVMGGALGLTQAQRICRLLDVAEREALPVVALVHSGGARIQEGVDGLQGYGLLFRRTVALSGRVPQITVAFGNCAGGAVYQPALTDVVIMCKGESRMFITGPTVVEAVTRERVGVEELGGWRVHAKRSGLCTLAVADEREAFARVRHLLRFLDPRRRHAAPVVGADGGDPGERVPRDGRKVYDVRAVLATIVDRESFLELHPDYARNLVVGFARIVGVPVGIVANQPRVLGGVLDCDASRKGARFVRLCDSFGLPVVTFVDCPGYLPGRRLEEEGIIVHGAKLLFAYCEAQVPRYTIVLRKGYGGAFIVLGSRAVGATAAWAWPEAEIGVMGEHGAVDLLYRRELAAAADPETLRTELRRRYREEILAPAEAARKGAIDGIVAPARTRALLAQVLAYGHSEPSHRKTFPL